ncbi:hypothetical protein GQ600_16522 [Phytophthora cactorum]|nr:hypothetical protein GQ600_16522 [Phytophthora cactorum]
MVVSCYRSFPLFRHGDDFDEAFLKEVDRFLISCNSPLYSAIDTIIECSTSESEPKLQLKVKPVLKRTSQSQRTLPVHVEARA